MLPTYVMSVYNMYIYILKMMPFEKLLFDERFHTYAPVAININEAMAMVKLYTYTYMVNKFLLYAN